MKTRNVVYATAILVLVLSSAVLVIGEDKTKGPAEGYASDDVLGVGVLSPGDYIEWELTCTHLDNISTFINRLTVMTVDHETGEVFYRAHCGMTDQVCSTDIFGFKSLIHAPTELLSDTDEVEVIYTPFGDRECTKHVFEAGTGTVYWTDTKTGIVYKEVQETNDNVSV